MTRPISEKTSFIDFSQRVTISNWLLSDSIKHDTFNNGRQLASAGSMDAVTPLRGVAASNKCVDEEIANAHPSISVNACRMHGMKASD